MGCPCFKGNRSECRDPSWSCTATVTHWLESGSAQGSRGAQIPLFPLMDAHRMPFWLIHVCSALALVLLPLIACEKWPSLFLDTWRCLRTLSLWWIICCFGSKSRYQFPGCKFCSQNPRFILQNLMPCNKSWGHELWSDRGQCLWQTSEYKEIKGPSLLKCPGQTDFATQSTSELN